jgi:hypothetical protein
MHDNATLERIRAEYLEMEGLRLTVAQAQRLFGMERTLCETVLEALVQEASLSLKSDGTYARRSDGDVLRPGSAAADRGSEDRGARAS